MVEADPNAGLYYVCSPNNPTGTLTPLADIAWLVANKPVGSMVLVDEASMPPPQAPRKSAANMSPMLWRHKYHILNCPRQRTLPRLPSSRLARCQPGPLLRLLR